jgi:hypothetical protein
MTFKAVLNDVPKKYCWHTQCRPWESTNAIFDINQRWFVFVSGGIKKRHLSLICSITDSGWAHTPASGLFCDARVCVTERRGARAAREEKRMHESRLARILMAGRDAAVKTICGFFDRGTFSRCARGGNYHPRPLGSVGRCFQSANEIEARGCGDHAAGQRETLSESVVHAAHPM